MTNTANPEVSRLLAVILRLVAGMNQEGFGTATGIGQSRISLYEQGKDTLSENAFRRMARAAKVPWWLAKLLHRFLEAFMAVVRRRRAAPAGEPLGLGILEPALLAAMPYLAEDQPEASRRQTEEEMAREAEETWAALQEDDFAERRRLIGLALDAGRSWALARHVGKASVEAAAGGEAEALAELARSIAESVWQDFLDRGRPYEAAQTVLDFAVLWLEAGRTPEVRALAAALEKIARTGGIDGEPLAALRVFRTAAEKEAATAELARRVGESLRRGRREPGLRAGTGR